VFIRFLLCLSISLACGHPSDTSPAPGKYPTETVHQLQSIHTEALASTQWRDNIPLFRDINDNGNSWLFGGLLCSSGQLSTCESLIASARGNYPCRAPWRYTDGGCLPGGDSFSRDEWLGVLLVLASKPPSVTRLSSRATIILLSDFSAALCKDASDTRCDMTPQLAGLTARVMQHIGQSVPLRYSASKMLDDHGLWVAAQSAPLGFQLHLVAVQLYIRQLIGDYPPILSKAATFLAQRQPQNPFFLAIAGRQQEAAAILIKLWPEAKGNTAGSQWAWQRATAESAWKASLGADFAFAAALLLAP
jgi:hypothetical protein